MKLVVILSAFMVVINAFSDHESWTNFKVTHSKSYRNIKEEQLRFQIFQNNLKRVEEHNAKYENGEVSYYLGVNHFADMTSEEFMATFNKQIFNRPTLNTNLFEAGDIKVEDSMDWRADAVLEVKNQQSCGTCWAFSTTGALEGQLAINKKQKISLSEQELVDCNTENMGCWNGGDMIKAYKYVNKNGLSSESSYNYTNEEGTCKSFPKVLETITSYRFVAAHENALKTAVGIVGPISVGVMTTKNWQLYAGGIFDDPSCQVDIYDGLNHAVLAVGYGTDKSDNKDYWIIKNSYGSTWGENGYIKLVRGKNLCGVANYASFPIL